MSDPATVIVLTYRIGMASGPDSEALSCSDMRGS